ncbi:MAG TPA: sigma 54-interacting transcriptional regulator [Polyangia bacterium]|nr:sigma 54-interacting transcriptional regulator [Polyangia bacterium]
MDFQIAVFVGENARTYDLPATGEVTIGRDDGNTVRIDDPSVSRRHAVLRVADGKVEIEDLGGANGIFVRDKVGAGVGNETLGVRQLVRRKADLAVGERILLGTASLVVRHAEVVDVPDLAAGAAAAGTGAVVRDPAMRAVYEQAARAARASISVLLLGETGVGKEVMARAIHAGSPRTSGPFMGINCAALAESLLEGELFGAEKGAYTGAVTARAGLFEAANGGTVFLDEVGEMPLATQGKLLRVLEERAVVRLGSTRPRPIDVRFVAATNRDIEGDSRAGRFRSDLYFRLAGMTLAIPPLRERPAELELLVARFVTASCRELERTTPLRMSAEALDLLRRYDWPGNVRELRNAIERAAVLCAGDTILPEHLPPGVLKPPASAASPPTAAVAPPAATPRAPSGENLQGEIKSLERQRIVEALERCGGNQSKAADLLGISRRTLVSRMSEFDLPRPRKPLDR